MSTGEVVFTVGAPGHLQGTVTKGIVSNDNIDNTVSPDNILYDLTVLPGSSGGGVFSEKGKMFGVLKASVGSAVNGNSLAIGIRKQVIEDFLKENMPNADYPSNLF
jgi:S1-C subfamily serine protease